MNRARRVRELRTEFGWPVATKLTGRPDLGIGIYILQADRQGPEHDRHIPDDLRGKVLRRDEYKCCECGWSHDEWNPSDPWFLELIISSIMLKVVKIQKKILIHFVLFVTISFTEMRSKLVNWVGRPTLLLNGSFQTIFRVTGVPTLIFDDNVTS